MIKTYTYIENHKSEEINYNVNESCGEVNWVQYNYFLKRLLINYRLSDVVYICENVPKEEYGQLKKCTTQREIDSCIEDITNKYGCSEI
jgi:hypothetical protein